VYLHNALTFAPKASASVSRLVSVHVVDCCAVGWFAIFASVETVVSYVPPFVSCNCAGVEDRPENIKWSKCRATIPISAFAQETCDEDRWLVEWQSGASQ
jgi:hypothetical protein